MTDLRQRYGAPSAVRRRLIVLLVGVVAAAGLVWLTWAAASHSRPEVTSELVSFAVVDDHRATAVFTVVRRDDATVANCVLRAIAEDHAIVGQSTVVVDSGARTSRAEASIRTERRATAVELLGCTAPGQNRPR